MAKIIYCTFLLVVFISTMITLSGGQLAECLTPRCNCCLHQVCGGNDYCTLGCVDGTWGNKCYNPCPGDCATCTKGSLESGYPCTSCIAGTWGNKCYNPCPGDCATCTKGSLESGYPCTSCIAGKYGTDCSNDCPTNCATCTLDSSNRGYICTTCVAEKYGTEDCRTSCSVGCDGGTCNIDGGCTCRDGYSGIKCDSCDSNTFGLFPTCSICPDKCITCNSIDSCSACLSGFWGQACDQICPIGCSMSLCNIDNGHCSSCKSEFTGERCDKCISGKYGTECKLNCISGNCKNNVCLNDSGLCSACKTGYYGDDKCDKPCSSNCLDSTCDFSTGVCSQCRQRHSGDKCCLNNNNCKTCSSNTRCSVCKDGYSGDKCCVNNDRCITCLSHLACSLCVSGYSGDKCCAQNSYCGLCSSNTECSKCIDGRYGSKCGEICPENCAQQPCNRDGSCFSCKTGHEGDICDKCMAGYFLESRSDTNCIQCSNFCKHGICEKLTGYCPNGCLDKYWGVACLNSCPVNCLICQRETGICEVCDHGKYKSDCSADCNAECQRTEQGQILCKIENGHCLTGCRTETLYGPLCQQLCSKNCINNECNWETGNCYECEGDKYGSSCELDCGSNCIKQGENQSRCYGSNGTCIHGCTNGYYGNKCDAAHSSEDVGSPTGQGAILGGSVGGSVVVIVLVVIIVICVIKRRHRNDSRSGDTMTRSGNQQIHTYYNTQNTDLSGSSASEVQSPEYEELGDLPKHRPVSECDVVATATVAIDTGNYDTDTGNYDKLAHQQDDAGQYDTIEETNKA